MALLDRVTTLVRANLNDLLDRAEDPEKMIRQLLLDMNGQLIEVKSLVAAAMADEQKLKKRWQEYEAQAADWHRRAEIAVKQDDDDLAAQALARYNTYANLAAGFQKQYEGQAAQVEELKDALRQLEAKIHEAQAKKDLLIARSHQAKAQVSIQRTLSGVGDMSALSSFERMEEKIKEQELRATALKELDKDTLDARFQQLEQESELQRQLQDLKQTVLEREEGEAPCETK